MKNSILKTMFLLSLAVISCEDNIVSEQSQPEYLRTILNEYYSGQLLVGAKPGDGYLNTVDYENLKKVFVQEFPLCIPGYEFGQPYVYYAAGQGLEDKYSYYFESARKNSQFLYVDAGIGDICSDWMKDESSPLLTQDNLSEILSGYLERLCQDFDKNSDVVKWMTVVRNPVSTGHEGLDYTGSVPGSFAPGDWMGPVSGIACEIPWTRLGMSDMKLDEESGNYIPAYIVDAFKITNELAPGIGQIIAQKDATLDNDVWQTVKNLVIAMRNGNISVDGIAWIPELDLENGVSEQVLQRLSLLIDWCYQNDVEFHILGLEVLAAPVNRWGVEDNAGVLEKQDKIAEVFDSIFEVVKKKIDAGVTTVSFAEFDGRYDETDGTYAALFDHDGNMLQSYSSLMEILKNKN